MPINMHINAQRWLLSIGKALLTILVTEVAIVLFFSNNYIVMGLEGIRQEFIDILKVFIRAFISPLAIYSLPLLILLTLFFFKNGKMSGWKTVCYFQLFIMALLAVPLIFIAIFSFWTNSHIF